MTLTVPLILLLGIVVALIHRSGGLKVWQSAVIALFGFAIGNSSANGPINAAMRYVLHGFGVR